MSFLTERRTLTLREWMSLPDTNTWLKYVEAEVYVRKSVRFFQGEEYGRPCLDMASVSVYRSKDQCKGWFTRWLEEAEQIAFSCGRSIYIENVLTPRFRAYFERSGYVRDERYPLVCACYIKLCPTTHE